MTSKANIAADLQQINWVNADQLSNLNPPEQMLSWLCEPGLLTSKVQQHCKTSFTLELLKADAANNGWLRHFADWPGKANYRREIVMHCDGKPGLYAETIVPDETLNQYPWIKSLGTQPLGKGLRLVPNVKRSAFNFAYIPTLGLPELPTSFLSNDLGINKTGHGLWARRSTYSINGFDLLLTEVFLAAITVANTEHP